MENVAKLSTADDLYHMSHDGVRRELIRGGIREMPLAGAEHGAIAGTIHALLWHQVLALRLGKVFAAETGFLVERNPDTVRAPDCAFVRADRLPSPLPKTYLPFAPDLAVEVNSPGDRPQAVREKVAQWLDAGALTVWVLDPRSRTVAVYRPGAEPRIFRSGDYLEGEDVVPGFRVEVESLWG